MNFLTKKVNPLSYILLFSLLFNFAQFAICNVKCCKSGYEEFVDSALAVWTQLDLVRATNASREYKATICQELMDKVLSLYCFCSRNSKDFDKDQKAEIINLLTQIEESFSVVFDDIKLPETTTSCTVLKRIRYSLEEPTSIKTKDAA